MQTVKIQTNRRPEGGKGPARRLRAEGKVPAVLYGKGMDAIALSLDPKEFVEAISGEMGQNVVLDLELDGATQRAQMAEYQVHPVSRELLHIDFKKVEDDQPVVRQVPLEFVGRAKGIVMGGILRQVFREVPVKCLPGQIPAKVTYDVSELEIDDIVHVEDLKLPEGISVELRARQTVGGVYGSRRRQKDEEDEEKKEGES